MTVRGPSPLRVPLPRSPAAPASSSPVDAHAPPPRVDGEAPDIDAMERTRAPNARVLGASPTASVVAHVEEPPRGAQAASLGARLLALAQGPAMRKAAAAAAVGLSLAGATLPTWADTVFVQGAPEPAAVEVARHVSAAVGERFVMVRPEGEALARVFQQASTSQLDLKHLVLSGYDGGTIDTGRRLAPHDVTRVAGRQTAALARVEHLHVLGSAPGAVEVDAWRAVFPNLKSVVGFELPGRPAARDAVGASLLRTAREGAQAQAGRLSPQSALIEARRLANAAASLGVSASAWVDGATASHAAPGDAPAVAAEARARAHALVPLAGSVGVGGRNATSDVRAVQQRLKELGFPVLVDGAWGHGTRQALRVFDGSLAAREKVDHVEPMVRPGDALHVALAAPDAPRWVRMPREGVGFVNADRDAHDYGSSVTVEVIQRAGERYQNGYRLRHPGAPPIATNDVSRSGGGDSRDHQSHEAGLDLDIRLPTRDGTSGTSVTSASYDRNAARAMIEAFIADPHVERILTGDPVLLREYRDSGAPNASKVQDGGPAHRAHLHIDIAPRAVTGVHATRANGDSCGASPG